MLGVPVESPAFVEVTDIEAGGTLDGLYNTIMSDSVYLFGTYVPIKWLILAAVGAATLLLCALAVFCYCCCCRRHTIVPASMQKTLSRPGILERKRSSYIDVEGSANTSQRRRTYTGHTTTPWSGASSDAGPPTPESSEARRDSAIELTIPAASRPPLRGLAVRVPRTSNRNPRRRHRRGHPRRRRRGCPRAGRRPSHPKASSTTSTTTPTRRPGRSQLAPPAPLAPPPAPPAALAMRRRVRHITIESRSASLQLRRTSRSPVPRPSRS